MRGENLSGQSSAGVREALAPCPRTPPTRETRVADDKEASPLSLCKTEKVTTMPKLFCGHAQEVAIWGSVNIHG